jgi:hypothetical protein
VAWLTSDATDYTVAALVPNIDPAGTGLTEWRLRQAGKTYPPGLLDRYTQGASLVGKDGQKLLADIRAWAQTQGNPFNNEYDVAKALQSYLHSDQFKYNTDITDQMARCGGPSTVDCFAIIREGFCEQYATTMTMLMRMEGYPARYVLGYLPGAIDPNTLVQQVTGLQSHAWVEVYFPTYGWIPFDPTSGPGQPTFLPPGSPAGVSASPSAPLIPGRTSTSRPSRSPGDQGGGPTTPGNAPVMLFIPVLLLLIAALAMFVWWRRRPRRFDEPDAVYRNIVRLASRIGYKPAPTQTVYEYTAMLATVVPKARDSLGVVATAKVEVIYGRRILGAERLDILASAQRAIRQALFRVVLRLPKIGGNSRSNAAGRGKGANSGSRR